MNEYGIKEEIYNEILKVFEEIKEVKQVILFGSRAKKTYKNTSDIDLAVKFQNEDKKLLLIRKLDEIRCILKFDILNIDTIQNEELLKNIQNEGITIFKR